MRLGWERCDGSTVPPDKRRAHLVSAWPSKRFQAYTEATSKLYIQGNQKANIYGLQLIPYPASSVALKGIEGRSFFFFFVRSSTVRTTFSKKLRLIFFFQGQFMHVSRAKCYLRMIKCGKTWEGIDCGPEKSVSVSHVLAKHYRMTQVSARA